MDKDKKETPRKDASFYVDYVIKITSVSDDDSKYKCQLLS